MINRKINSNKKGLEIFESFVFVILFYVTINVEILPYFATTWCVFDVFATQVANNYRRTTNYSALSVAFACLRLSISTSIMS